MAKLKVLHNYRNDPRSLAFVAGTEIEVDDELALFLRTDAPGGFEPLVDKPKPERRTTAADEPQADEPKPKTRRTRRKSG